MNTLKPCPFCGGLAELRHPGYECYSPCWCKCTQCGAEGPTKSSELEAEELWNKRIEMQPEIIRCRDCKYMYRLSWLDDETSKAMVCIKHNYTGMRKEDFFCADGEKKGE